MKIIFESVSGTTDKFSELTENDLQTIIEVLQEQVTRNQERMDTLHVDTAFVRGFPEYSLALRAHCEINNMHCYRIMAVLKKARPKTG